MNNIFNEKQLGFKISSIGLVYNNFRICGEVEAICGFCDLLKVELENDNVQAFDPKWDEVVSLMNVDMVLNKLYHMQLEAYIG